jgi:hypothetical protein
MSRTGSASSIVPVLAAGVILNVFGGVMSPPRERAAHSDAPAKVAAAPAVADGSSR